MKKFSLIAGLCLAVALTARGQEEKTVVPKAVVDSFKTMFPEAKAAEWDSESPFQFEVGFMLHGVEHEAFFNELGTWQRTSFAIRLNELPQPVLETLAERYAEYKVDAANRVDDQEAGLFYAIDVHHGENVFTVYISVEGDVLGDEVDDGSGGEGDPE